MCKISKIKWAVHSQGEINAYLLDYDRFNVASPETRDNYSGKEDFSKSTSYEIGGRRGGRGLTEVTNNRSVNFPLERWMCLSLTKLETALEHFPWVAKQRSKSIKDRIGASNTCDHFADKNTSRSENLYYLRVRASNIYISLQERKQSEDKSLITKICRYISLTKIMSKYYREILKMMHIF